MSFTLSKANISDAEDIARHVDVPAMQNGPLYRTMFPRFETITEAQTNEIIRWYVEMLEDALQDGLETLWKVCSVDGTPVGFCGWIVIERKVETDSQMNKLPKEKKPKKTGWVPGTLDIDGWIALSKALRTERDRVLMDLDNICRKLVSVAVMYLLTDLAGLTFMAVNPIYQRQGIGSMMMQRICEEADQHGRYAYVLAAPEGVPLYTKFGFEVVGHVQTPYGAITSMLRSSRQDISEA